MTLRTYLHRDAHRANRFSVWVADVQAALAAETLQANIIPMPLSVGEPGYA